LIAQIAPELCVTLAVLLGFLIWDAMIFWNLKVCKTADKEVKTFAQNKGK
jgi:hypothetical protein